MTLADHLRTLDGRCPACLLDMQAQGHRSIDSNGNPTGCDDSGKLGLILARERRDKGMARTVQAHPDDASIVDRVLEQRIKAGGEFSLNDLRPALAAVKEKHVIGARVQAFARAKRIVRTGYTPSTDPRTNGHPIATWKAAA